MHEFLKNYILCSDSETVHVELIRFKKKFKSFYGHYNNCMNRHTLLHPQQQQRLVIYLTRQYIHDKQGNRYNVKHLLNCISPCLLLNQGDTEEINTSTGLGSSGFQRRYISIDWDIATVFHLVHTAQCFLENPAREMFLF